METKRIVESGLSDDPGSPCFRHFPFPRNETTLHTSSHCSTLTLNTTRRHALATPTYPRTPRCTRCTIYSTKPTTRPTGNVCPLFPFARMSTVTAPQCCAILRRRCVGYSPGEWLLTRAGGQTISL